MNDLTNQEAIAAICVSAAEAKSGANIISLQVTEVSSVADYFVVISATSDPQIRAVCNNIERELLEKLRVKCKVEGSPESQWVLLDCGGAVLVHVMTPEVRAKFQLENLWGDAIRRDNLGKENKAKKAAAKAAGEKLPKAPKASATKKAAAKTDDEKAPKAAKTTTVKKTAAKTTEKKTAAKKPATRKKAAE